MRDKNQCPAEQITKANMKARLRTSQWDVLSLTGDIRMYHPSPQENFTHFNVADGSWPPSVDVLPPMPAEVSFYCNYSTVAQTTLIKIVNKAQQCKVDLNACENKLMARFQEVLYLIQPANSSNSTHASSNKATTQAIKTKQNALENHNSSLINTVELMGAVCTPEMSASANPTTKRMVLTSPTCLVALHQGDLGWRNDNLGLQIVAIS